MFACRVSFVIGVVVLACVVSISGRVYDRCELARELRDRHGLPAAQIATWVCIARHESQFNTSAVNHDSGDHGLFQISDLFWCSPPGGGYACGLTCADLEDDDIEDDVICAKRIFREHTRISGDGFNAWVVYGSHCKGRDVNEYVENCFGGKTSEGIDNFVVKYSDKKMETTTGYYSKAFTTPKYYSSTSTYRSSTTPKTTIKSYYSTPTTTSKVFRSRFAKPTSDFSRSANYLQSQKSFVTTTTVKPKVETTKSSIFSREMRKHKFIEHPTGSRYKYHINKSGFVLFKDN